MESHRGQQYIGEKKLTVTLYTYINHHVGTPKQKQTSLKKNQTTPRLSEHSPVMGEKMSKRLGGIKRLQIQNLFMAFKQVPRCR